MTTQWPEAFRETVKRSLTEIPEDVYNILRKVGNNAFYSCSSLTSVNLPACITVGDSAFYSCSSLTSVNLPACTSMGNYSFKNCSNLTSVNLPACITVNNVFSSCTRLKEIHFSYHNKAAIMALYYYSFKFGASNATIYFDLEIALMTLSEVNGVTYIIDGALVTDSDLQDGNVYAIVPKQAHTLIAYKTGYCLVIDSITPADETAFTYTAIWTTTGTTYAIDASSAPNGTPTITFTHNGVILASTTATIGSIIVPADTSIDYMVKLRGYEEIRGTLKSATDKTVTISDWEKQAYETYDMSYPFTGYESELANLVDDNNFIIVKSPTPYNGSYNTMSPSIVSGAKTFGVDSSYAYGYIKFHTPATTDTDLLTVSVTCNAYVETYSDMGFVYIDNSLHQITSNVRLSTASGKTDSTYGYILYNSRDKSTATYSTYTKVLDADTDYYLQFAYTKDSSSSRYWDRLSITNIKFTDTGTY